MSKIKLIASDIDGTLLLNGAQSCCPETFTLIHHLWEKGILFAAARKVSWTFSLSCARIYRKGSLRGQQRSWCCKADWLLLPDGRRVAVGNL